MFKLKLNNMVVICVSFRQEEGVRPVYVTAPKSNRKIIEKRDTNT
jgi:hypothetical protein